MKIYISQLLEKSVLNQLINKYNVGLELIDFSIASNLDNPQEYLEKYQNTNYPIALHGPFFDLMPASFDVLIKEVTMKRFEQAYQCAKKIKAKHIIFHTGYLRNIYYYEGWLQNSIIFWKEFLKNKDDMMFYIENVFEDDFNALNELVSTINQPNFKICLDFGHANIQTNDKIKNTIKLLKDNIGHLHIHNNDGINDLHQSIKRGNINYDLVFALLQEYNIKADITLEMTKVKELSESIDYLEQEIDYY